MRVTDATKYHCPLCQSRCRGEGCMFWRIVEHNQGECTIKLFIIGISPPAVESAPKLDTNIPNNKETTSDPANEFDFN